MVSFVVFLEWEVLDWSIFFKENVFMEWEDIDLSEFFGKVVGVVVCVFGFEIMMVGNLD